MSKIYYIALNTLRETLRSKVVYSTVFFAYLVIIISSAFGSVSIGDFKKLVKDFSLFSMTYFTILFSVISGGALLFKELEKKTIYNILAKSVSRAQFVIGKFLGMFFTALVILLSILLGVLAYLYFLEGQLDLLFLQAIPFIILQVLIVCACTILFSTISITPSLTGTFAFAVFFLGRSSSYIKQFAEDVIGKNFPPFLLDAIYWCLPHLDQIDINNQVIYGVSATIPQFLYACGYSLFYSLIVLILSIIFFNNKEFN